MGWVWKEVTYGTGCLNSWEWEDEGDGKEASIFTNPCPKNADESKRKKVIKSNCRTEEVGPGKFIRKSENVMEIQKIWGDGKPMEVVETRSYCTEEEVPKERATPIFPWYY